MSSRDPNINSTNALSVGSRARGSRCCFAQSAIPQQIMRKSPKHGRYAYRSAIAWLPTCTSPIMEPLCQEP